MLAGVLLMISSCNCGRTADAGTDEGETKAGYMDRYEAANAISNSTTKDEALAAVAVDAAKGGDGEVVKKSVQSISNSAANDTAASTAAVALANVGKGKEAREVAQMIHNSAKKDDTLAKIAKGG